MADDIRRDPLNEPSGPSEPIPERQGVREPQPIEEAGGSELGSRREFEAGDLARENEPRPGHDRSTEARQTGPSRTSREDRGLLDRVKDAWDRIRHRD